MIKKILLFSVIISQLTVSCSSDEPVNAPEGSLTEQIANIIKQPYSKLTPAEQKVKLEAEANVMLVQMDKSKTSGAIEAIQNLGDLLNISSVDIFDGKNDNEIEDILNVSGVYGIYTWNNSTKIWVKTTSTTELKFVFPAKASQTANNASLSSKSNSSTIKVKLEDSYNWQSGTTINDEIFLPTSVDAILTIDGIQAATFATTAKYTGTVETPDESSFKMVLNDGYTYEISGSKKATQNTAKSSFTYNGKNLVSFTAGSTADIDNLLKDDAVTQYQGKANGLVQIMDNFIIVAEMDIAGQAKDDEALEKSLVYPDRQKKTYYTDLNAYNIKNSESETSNHNKNVKLILVSKKDGTKIADVIQRSDIGYSFNTSEYEVWVNDASNIKYGGSWEFDWNNGVPKGTAVKIQQYDEVLYLKFGDSTEVAMSSYFSTGFDKLETKFEDFLKAFER
ncbi:hypothetical protein E0I26_03080 [Flavobacterium rhamnosiphilum]|uniref:Uncharacterized protein n=1 Tax=Flavobacterium rhamnosiphilum TaxID=2541724 RepID=A0A4R5FE00_9FLAO|nr:hypothetical protein [Flavobacterium rhamnosiphilum]TDE47085.1 hypothetical protein E0I26_03080 [Flavobacterium rhamnosiphilum]